MGNGLSEQKVHRVLTDLFSRGSWGARRPRQPIVTLKRKRRCQWRSIFTFHVFWQCCKQGWNIDLQVYPLIQEDLDDQEAPGDPIKQIMVIKVELKTLHWMFLQTQREEGWKCHSGKTHLVPFVSRVSSRSSITFYTLWWQKEKSIWLEKL